MKLTSMFARLAAVFLALTPGFFLAADTLPSQLSDSAYWKMISDFSEPDNSSSQFAEWLTGNESGYQYPLPALTKAVAPGGVYLGVGPEQNFTYIAAVRPKIAFLIDFRREILLEHLMYKAIFETSADRADFVGKLFSRKRPAELTADSSVNSIFAAYGSIRADSDLEEAHLKEILSRLKTVHQFPLSDQDAARIRGIHLAFFRYGLQIANEGPGYQGMMTSTDADGRNWSFLASKENYERVRTLQEKNLIVPLVGDFSGPKTLRMVGEYVRDHGAIVNVFYVSNVENYLRSELAPGLARSSTWQAWTRNAASLPIDDSSQFIRWLLGAGRSNWLASIAEFVRTGEVR
jgi:hypothetical protein